MNYFKTLSVLLYALRHNKSQPCKNIWLLANNAQNNWKPFRMWSLSTFFCIKWQTFTSYSFLKLYGERFLHPSYISSRGLPSAASRYWLTFSVRAAPTTVAPKLLGQTAASLLDHVTWMLIWDAAALHRRDGNIRADETAFQGNNGLFFLFYPEF